MLVFCKYFKFRFMPIKKWPFIVIIIALSFWFYGQEKVPSYYEETVKIALRDAGNRILLHSQDSTSLVMPIQPLEGNRYELSFQNPLEIDPDALVDIINTSVTSSELSNNYIVQVIKCDTKEIAYSYQIKGNKEDNIVPCSGRKLPVDCYTINIIFMENIPGFMSSGLSVYLLLGVIAILLLFLFNKSRKGSPAETPKNAIDLGDYTFYYEQHLLKKGNEETSLTLKESELLKIFGQHPNQLIKRDRLLKEVWEDKGVFVGRSLDMFVSKLRKKLNDDSSIKIVNVHGIGYRMEV